MTKRQLEDEEDISEEERRRAFFFLTQVRWDKKVTREASTKARGMQASSQGGLNIQQLRRLDTGESEAGRTGFFFSPFFSELESGTKLE